MAEIIELKTKEKKIDETAAKTWSPLDCLKACIADIESKKIDATHIYIAMLINDTDDTQRLAFAQAGMDSSLETIGMLKIHVDFHTSEWFDIEE